MRIVFAKVQIVYKNHTKRRWYIFLIVHLLNRSNSKKDCMQIKRYFRSLLYILLTLYCYSYALLNHHARLNLFFTFIPFFLVMSFFLLESSPCSFAMISNTHMRRALCAYTYCDLLWEKWAETNDEYGFLRCHLQGKSFSCKVRSSHG